MKEFTGTLEECIFLCHYAHTAKHHGINTAEDISYTLHLDMERAKAVAEFMKDYDINPADVVEPIFDEFKKKGFFRTSISMKEG